MITKNPAASESRVPVDGKSPRKRSRGRCATSALLPSESMGKAENTMHTYRHVTSVWYKYRPIYVTTKKPNALSFLSNHLRVVVVTAEVGRGAVELDGLAVHAAVRAVRDQSLLSTSCGKQFPVSDLSRWEHRPECDTHEQWTGSGTSQYGTRARGPEDPSSRGTSRASQ